MTNILHIDSSIFSEMGQSSQLTAKLVEELQGKLAQAKITYRNLADGTIPHFSAETIAAIGEGKAVLADQLISELVNADILVLGVPMYNFAVPSTLKAWIDHVARAGVTFKYTETGPVGLLLNKKAFVVFSRGGIHKDQPSDVETAFIKIFLGFLGIEDVDFVYAEGLNMGDHKNTSLELAQAEIGRLVNNYVS